MQNNDNTKVKHSLKEIIYDADLPKKTAKKQVSFKIQESLDKQHDQKIRERMRDKIMKERGLRKVTNIKTGQVKYITPENSKQLHKQTKINEWQRQRH